MPTEVVDNPVQQRFEISVDGAPAGFTEYRPGDGVVEFPHTVIDDAFEGQGLGSALIRGALDAMRERGLRVRPTCPFVKRFIEKHSEYADLLA